RRCSSHDIRQAAGRIPDAGTSSHSAGKTPAGNLVRLSQNKTLVPFSYFDKGVMATVGRNKALIDAKGIHLHGFLAWIAWLFVHLMYLVGFRNRIVVFINWLVSYVSYDSAMRLMIRPYTRNEEQRNG